MVAKQDIESEDLSIAMATYMPGFGSYIGFIPGNSEGRYKKDV